MDPQQQPTMECAPAPTPVPEHPPQQPMESQPMAQPVAQPMMAQPMGAPAGIQTVDPGKGMGIASLILAFFAPLIGLILGIIARGKSKKAGHKNGLALAGIIISCISMVISTIVIIIVIAAGASVVAKCKDLGPGTHYDNGTTITCS